LVTSLVRNNQEMSRYELVVDDDVVGIADYLIDGALVVVAHSEIASHLRGRGFGAVLVRGVLDDLRVSGRTVVPRCWYVAQFIQEHPEFHDLV
jgi:predicted GNAT family acetyltransferase